MLQRCHLTLCTQVKSVSLHSDSETTIREVVFLHSLRWGEVQISGWAVEL